MAKNNLHLLKNFTHQRTLAQLKSGVTKAKMALERANRKAGADIVQVEAELKAKESEFKRQRDKLAKIERQIEKTKIYAPADGLVRLLKILEGIYTCLKFEGNSGEKEIDLSCPWLLISTQPA